MDLSRSIGEAWRARTALEREPELDCYRLFHGWAEGCPGLEIDRYADAAAIAYRPELADLVPAVVDALDACRRFDVIVARARGGQGSAPPSVLRGAPPAGPSWIVREHGLRFAVDLLRAGNPGLYLDARPARRWIREQAAGRRVLNLFAFTGSLGVAAAVGGARPVAHVDSHRGALDWCRLNSELNQVAVDARDLARMNIYQHIRRAQAGRQRYGAIILDPPPGPERPRRKDRTPGERGTLALVPQVARMLEPGGWLLCFFHHDPREQAALEAEVTTSDSRLELLWRGESGPDFPDSPVRRKLRVSAWSARAGGEPPTSPGATGRAG